MRALPSRPAFAVTRPRCVPAQGHGFFVWAHRKNTAETDGFCAPAERVVFEQKKVGTHGHGPAPQAANNAAGLHVQMNRQNNSAVKVNYEQHAPAPALLIRFSGVVGGAAYLLDLVSQVSFCTTVFVSL